MQLQRTGSVQKKAMEQLGYEIDMNEIMAELHPAYELTNDRDFVKQLYRLEGFVHLRNH